MIHRASITVEDVAQTKTGSELFLRTPTDEWEVRIFCGDGMVSIGVFPTVRQAVAAVSRFKSSMTRVVPRELLMRLNELRQRCDIE